MTEPAIAVTLREKQSVVFKGLANRVSSYNEKGAFDIYPYHANFIAVVSQQLELQTPNGKIQKLSIPRSILHVRENNVEVYIGI